jgi:hypothetical protein
MISDDAGNPLLDGSKAPRRDETSPPWVGSSTTLDCAGAAGADEVGSTIAEDGGRTPVEDGTRPPKRDERSPPWVGSSTTLDCAGAAGADEVGSTIADDGGRTPVDDWTTLVLLGSSFSVSEGV